MFDFELTVDWKKNVGIGEYKENHWSGNRRAFCDDRFKLNVLFPADLRSPRIYKNAPFDVCESTLDNTFFNSWDQIKHNIIIEPATNSPTVFTLTRFQTGDNTLVSLNKNK